MTKIAVLIPCFNEELTIAKVIDDHKRALPKADIYVYDNNSTDQTAAIARRHGATTRSEPRQGKGNVARSMFHDIDADVYYMVDGDDTYPAEKAPELIQLIADGKADMAIGDRLSSTYFTENKRFGHSFGNKLVRFMINKLFKANVRDIMTGQRAFSYEFVKTYPVLAKGFEIETDMTIHALDKNLLLLEAPIEYRNRPEGSVSKLDTTKDGVRVLWTIFNLVREYKPLLFFTIFSLIFFMAAVVAGAPIIDQMARGEIVVRVPTIIGVFILIVISILLFIAGLILDLIVKKNKQTFEMNRNLIKTLRRDDK
ncbi:MAG: glycosyltransferase family 2 protein [Candidatus Nomurabacteria bacterium]|jgi:glycosyltransferase involved in cell wall biosynthesis|nr:glycosyltransferase family 2 protein [Candidatus Nomurabacteria bacterium]